MKYQTQFINETIKHAAPNTQKSSYVNKFQQYRAWTPQEDQNTIIFDHIVLKKHEFAFCLKKQYTFWEQFRILPN